MKTMMLADFLALAKSLRKWALLFVLLAFGMCLVFGGTPALILFISFPFAHTVLAPMLMRDQDRGWNAFRQALPLSRTDVVAGRYASIAIVVTASVSLGAAIYMISCVINVIVPGLPLIAHFTQGFDAPGLISFSAATFSITIAAFGLSLPFMFSDNHRKAINYIPFTFMMAIAGWIYIFRTIDFDAFLPLVGRIVVAAQSLGGALVVGGCVTAAALALYVVSERAAVRGYATRDL